MNKLKKFAIGVTATGILLVSALPAFAAPEQPNCLGQDISGLAQALGGDLGSFVSTIASTTTNGVGDEVLLHKQGLEPNSTCPLNGFPTPLH